MTTLEKQAAIDRFLDQLTQKIQEYRECVELDEIFEVRKRICMLLKEN